MVWERDTLTGLGINTKDDVSGVPEQIGSFVVTLLRMKKMFVELLGSCCILGNGNTECGANLYY